MKIRRLFDISLFDILLLGVDNEIVKETKNL